ncbi:MAG: hypothetical protein NTY07_12930 [Bacteroidia bacterium]|nr:hypothetical protein [Bacteroidia bacterium]
MNKQTFQTFFGLCFAAHTAFFLWLSFPVAPEFGVLFCFLPIFYSAGVLTDDWVGRFGYRRSSIAMALFYRD